jgi:hypothetical protein
MYSRSSSSRSIANWLSSGGKYSFLIPIMKLLITE